MALLRVLASGDHHFEEGPRFAECKRTHAVQVDMVAADPPAVFVSTGDLFHKRSTITERHAAADFIMGVATHCPVLLVDGNHAPHEIAIFRRLRTKFPVIVEEGAVVHVLGGVAIGAMAWPSTSMLSAASGRQLGDLDASARACFQDLIRGMGAILQQHDGPRMIAGHFMLDGSIAATGQPLIGLPLNISLTDLAYGGVQLVVMGHIHKPQDWTFGNMIAAYTGSPYRTAFGELEDKSVLRATFDGQRLLAVERIDTGARGMHLLNAVWDGTNLDVEFPPAEALRGADVRVRYEVAADQRPAATRAAEAVVASLYALGAAQVKPEPEILATTIARAPEVATAKGLKAQVTASLRRRGRFPDPERWSRIEPKVAILEGSETES
jgi:exonuclease SbcD